VLLTEFATAERTNYFATITALLAVAGRAGARGHRRHLACRHPAGGGGLGRLPALGLAYRFSPLTFAGTLVLAVGWSGRRCTCWARLVAGQRAIDLYRDGRAGDRTRPVAGPPDAGMAEMVRLAGLLLAAGAIVLCAGNGGLSVLPMRPGVV
jgi:hypothetical protein